MRRSGKDKNEKGNMKLFLAPFKLRNELKFPESYGNIINKEEMIMRLVFIQFYQLNWEMEEKNNASRT